MNEWIDNYEDKSVGVGASPGEITSIEQALVVSLPESFRSFLRRYGWGRFGTEEFYGAGPDVPAYLRLSANTIAEREAMQPSMKHSLVPVLNDGSGNHFCLETEHMDNGECPVVFWDHDEDENQRPATEGTSFDLWIVDYLSDLQTDTAV